MSTDSNSYESQVEITACPTSISDPDLQDQSKWTSYDNVWGSAIFHGGNEGFLENIEPSPEHPQQECFYDKSGDLIDQNHEYSGTRGTANEYDGHNGDIVEQWNHFYNDQGGIWENGRDAFATSMDYYYDSAVDSAVEAVESLYEHSFLESVVEEIESGYDYSPY